MDNIVSTDVLLINVVFVSNPAYQTQYGCAQCHFKTFDFEKLMDHKSSESHLKRGIVDSVISTRQIPIEVRSFEISEEVENMQYNASEIAFREYGGLKKHILNDHKEMSDPCTNVKTSLVKSKVKRNKAINSKCKICDKVYANKAKLKIHMDCIHLKTKKKCRFCDLLVKTEYFSEHIMSHKTKKFKCEECDYKAISTMYVRIHKNRMHSEKTLACDDCGKMFSNQDVFMSKYFMNSYI